MLFYFLFVFYSRFFFYFDSHCDAVFVWFYVNSVSMHTFIWLLCAFVVTIDFRLHFFAYKTIIFLFASLQFRVNSKKSLRNSRNKNEKKQNPTSTNLVTALVTHISSLGLPNPATCPTFCFNPCFTQRNLETRRKGLNTVF